MNRLQDLQTITPQDVENALLRNDPAELQMASITVALSDLEFSFVQSVCVRLASHGSAGIRCNALISLGHMARRFRALDETVVKPIVESALADPDNAVRDCAQSAANEIHQFLHWQIRGHRFE